MTSHLPPWYGVASGPLRTAFQEKRLSWSIGSSVMSAGLGSSTLLRSSLISLFVAIDSIYGLS